ncbi:MAG: sulfatase-like hydrolase/transferase [Victivallales bacterium]|nr:sulfatase-like hydrolase/transferase [Victivallales bacterium]
MNEKPDIVIVMTDQQRADSLSCAGHPQLRTPNIDRIAGQGTRFGQCTTVCPVCMPARASFINGLYPHNHGMWRNSGCMPPEDETFFHHLQSAGYNIAHIGKSHYYEHTGWDGEMWHMRNHEPYMRARGLDHVDEIPGPLATQVMRCYMTDDWEERGLMQEYIDDYAERGRLRRENPFWVRPSPRSVELFPDSYVGRKSVEYIKGHDTRSPMCLFVGFPGPHEPWDAPGKYAEMYSPDQTPPAVPYQEADNVLPDPVREMEDFMKMGDNTCTPEAIARVRANYYGKISLIDDWIGRILDAIENRGNIENTIIVFWSDHGELLGDHGRVYKETFHESSMRVPLIVSWPGRFASGVESDALVEIIDIFPTILDSLGIELSSARCVGNSLLPLLEGAGGTLRDAQLSEIDSFGERRFCVRTRSCKYAVREDGIGYMLYDLERDPSEQNNLIGKDKKLEKEMREMLLQRLMASQY